MKKWLIAGGIAAVTMFGLIGAPAQTSAVGTSNGMTVMAVDGFCEWAPIPGFCPRPGYRP